MKSKFMAIFLALFCTIFFAFSASADSTKLSQGLSEITSNQSGTLEKDVLQNALKFQGFGATQVIPSNMTCGFAPFPPLGCKNPRCICEVQNGQQVCRWVFQCS
jgi:hypothetical protein